MAKEMYDYLSAVTADYTTTELSISPKQELVEMGEKEQFVHKFSDGQRGVVTMSDTSHFQVTLVWDILSPEDAGTIMDFFHDTGKGNGIARSFYWSHPTDGHTYTVKFMEPLSQSFSVNLPGKNSIKQMTLDILGVKP